jgi:hypothetical protein
MLADLSYPYGDASGRMTTVTLLAGFRRRVTLPPYCLGYC